LEGWRRRSAAWYLTWGIVYEFLRVTTHLRVLRQPWSPIDAWGFIEALLSSPGADCLTPTPRHPAVVSEVLKDVPDLRGNLIHDATTAILMHEHGIRTIYTFDMDFHRFPFITVVDPGAA
jgi:predicted nucleic acid-binding protein